MTNAISLKKLSGFCSVHQVVNYDKAADDDEKPLISLPCMRSLVKISGVTFEKRKRQRKTETKVHIFCETFLYKLMD